MQTDPTDTMEEHAETERGRATASDIKDTLHSCGEKIRDAVEDRTRDLGESALHSISASIGAYGLAFRRASEALEEQEEHGAASLTDQVSRTLENSADTIGNASTDEAIDFANEQIRLRPALALGCAFTIGLAVSRLIGAREPEEETSR